MWYMYVGDNKIVLIEVIGQGEMPYPHLCGREFETWEEARAASLLEDPTLWVETIACTCNPAMYRLGEEGR